MIKMSENENEYTFGDKNDAVRQLEDDMGSEGSYEVAERMYQILWDKDLIEYHGGLLRPVVLSDEDFNELWLEASEG
jgi:lipopolysaccharide biosynthesis regulator YciM